MAFTFDAFFWSLTQQESGGNYGAVGPETAYGRAYGRYQVLGSNIPSWTKQYYGKSLTPGQFLADRAAQDAVARGKLRTYVSQYGYRGAAAAWYAGPGNAKNYNSTSPQSGGPSIKGYVDSIMDRALTYKGQSTGGTSATSAPAALDDDLLAEQYGLTRSLINSSKELKNLFREAVKQGYTPALFQAKLKNTRWWRNQPDSLRKYVTLKYTDPATWRQNNTAAAAKINALAVQVGMGTQLSKNKQSKLLRQAVYNSLALGWTDARLKDWIGTRVTTHDGVMWGEAGEAFDKLHEIAYLNGMRYGSWYTGQARGIVSGRTTLEAAEATIRRQAAAKYSAFAEQIKAGQNALDLASPYIKTVSGLLELPETDVDLQTKLVNDAMTGAKAGASYPLWEFENKVREDPRWRKTNNAREGMMTTARSVLKDFGLSF